MRRREKKKEGEREARLVGEGLRPKGPPEVKDERRELRSSYAALVESVGKIRRAAICPVVAVMVPSNLPRTTENRAPAVR